MWRCFFVLFLIGGCAKPPDLPEITVRASTAGELTVFRSELDTRFTPGQLEPFDTAVQELQLDAMDRGVATVSERELDMLAKVNGKSVHETLILGWQARRHRLLGQIALMTGVIEQNLKLQQKTAATGTPESVTTHLQNTQDILARLQQSLADTEHHLAGWGAMLDLAGPPKVQK